MAALSQTAYGAMTARGVEPIVLAPNDIPNCKWLKLPKEYYAKENVSLQKNVSFSLHFHPYLSFSISWWRIILYCTHLNRHDNSEIKNLNFN